MENEQKLHSIEFPGGIEVVMPLPGEGEWIADAMILARYVYTTEDGGVEDYTVCQWNKEATNTARLGLLTNALNAESGLLDMGMEYIEDED